MGDGGGGVRREFLLCLYGMLIYHKLVPPRTSLGFPIVWCYAYTMLRRGGGGGGGGTVRVMYATQEHNLLAQRSHKLYISHHHKKKAWKPTKQEQKKTATATANACIQETGDSLVSRSIFGYK